MKTIQEKFLHVPSGLPPIMYEIIFVNDKYNELTIVTSSPITVTSGLLTKQRDQIVNNKEISYTYYMEA